LEKCTSVDVFDWSGFTARAYFVDYQTMHLNMGAHGGVYGYTGSFAFNYQTSDNFILCVDFESLKKPSLLFSMSDTESDSEKRVQVKKGEKSTTLGGVAGGRHGTVEESNALLFFLMCTDARDLQPRLSAFVKAFVLEAKTKALAFEQACKKSNKQPSFKSTSVSTRTYQSDDVDEVTLALFAKSGASSSSSSFSSVERKRRAATVLVQPLANSRIRRAVSAPLSSAADVTAVTPSTSPSPTPFAVAPTKCVWAQDCVVGSARCVEDATCEGACAEHQKGFVRTTLRTAVHELLCVTLLAVSTFTQTTPCVMWMTGPLSHVLTSWQGVPLSLVHSTLEVSIVTDDFLKFKHAIRAKLEPLGFSVLDSADPTVLCSIQHAALAGMDASACPGKVLLHASTLESEPMSMQMWTCNGYIVHSEPGMLPGIHESSMTELPGILSSEVRRMDLAFKNRFFVSSSSTLPRFHDACILDSLSASSSSATEIVEFSESPNSADHPSFASRLLPSLKAVQPATVYVEYVCGSAQGRVLVTLTSRAAPSDILAMAMIKLFDVDASCAPKAVLKVAQFQAKGAIAAAKLLASKEGLHGEQKLRVFYVDVICSRADASGAGTRLLEILFKAAGRFAAAQPTWFVLEPMTQSLVSFYSRLSLNLQPLSAAPGVLFLGVGPLQASGETLRCTAGKPVHTNLCILSVATLLRCTRDAESKYSTDLRGIWETLDPSSMLPKVVPIVARVVAYYNAGLLTWAGPFPKVTAPSHELVARQLTRQWNNAVREMHTASPMLATFKFDTSPALFIKDLSVHYLREFSTAMSAHQVCLAYFLRNIKH
jgi:hypothetical protein